MGVPNLRKSCATIAVGLVVLSMPSLAWARDPSGFWALRKFKNLSVAPSSPEAVTFIFGRGNRLGGAAACSYFIGDRIKWFEGKRPKSGFFLVDRNKDLIWTTIACRNAAASKIGGEFWTEMEHSKTWSISKRTLIIRFNDGTLAMLEPVSHR